MKLMSVLRTMDDDDTVVVTDVNAPIDEYLLFEGSVEECKQQGYFRNGVVTSLCAYENEMLISVDIEYQKKKKAVQSNGSENY